MVHDARVHHIEVWFLTAQSCFPHLPHKPTREADAEADTQSAENSRDGDLPSMPCGPHRMFSTFFFLSWRVVLIGHFF